MGKEWYCDCDKGNIFVVIYMTTRIYIYARTFKRYIDVVLSLNMYKFGDYVDHIFTYKTLYFIFLDFFKSNNIAKHSSYRNKIVIL
jgi:hypothetical protein